VEKNSCDFCEEKFFIPANLDFHLETEHRDLQVTKLFKTKPFPCIFCKKLVRGKCNVRRHLKSMHKGEKTFWCKMVMCSTVFKSQSSLKEHFEQVHLLKEGNPVKCEVCKKWFANNSNWTKHMSRTHLETYLKLRKQRQSKLKPNRNGTKTILSCKFCTERFEDKVDWYQHTKIKHKNEAVKCKICLSFFKSKQQMEEHFKEKHENYCKFCQSIFTSAVNLSWHNSKIHKDKKCKFGKCQFFTDSKKEMENHVRDKHDKNLTSSWKCLFCDQMFVKQFERTNHILKMHSDIAIRCDFFHCHHFVKDPAELEKHKTEVHQKHKKTVVCLFCQKTIWDQTNYILHVNSHHSEEAVRCKQKYCATFFKSEKEMENHHEQKHNGKYACNFCNHITSNKNYLAQHIKTHLMHKDVKCPHCPKLFINKGRLNLHIIRNHKPKQKCPHCHEVWTHSSRHIVTTCCPTCTKPFPCKKLFAKHKIACKMVFDCRECGINFNKEWKLIHHLNGKHASGQKWKGFQCKKCGKLFPEKKSMRMHQLSDHLEMVKRCKLCDNGSYVSYLGLHHHMFRAHGIGGIRCKKCGKRFLYKNLLEAHLKWNHGKDNPRSKIVECAECGYLLKKSSFAIHYFSNHCKM